MRFRGVSRSATTMSDGGEHDPDEDDVGIGELVLADDPGGPDAEAGDDEDENGSDQHEKHGEGPLPDLVGEMGEQEEASGIGDDRDPPRRPKSSDQRAGCSIARASSSTSRS